MNNLKDHFGVTGAQLRTLVAEGLKGGGDWCDLFFEHTIYNDLLLAPDPVKRKLLTSLFGVFDPKGKLKEHMIMEEADPRCEETRTVLFEKYSAAVPAAADLIGRFPDMAGESADWDDIFDLTFDSVKI